jgi:dihydrofolate synthase/folylpolyglutamate synthase
VKAVEVLERKGFNISKDSIYNGLKKISIPGRIEVINSSPEIILDSGHNVEGIIALKEYLEQKKINNLTLVFGVLRDKNYKKMISLLLPYIKRVVLTEPISKRALSICELKKFFPEKSLFLERDLSESLKIAKGFNKNILITGSIYLAGEMRNIIFGGSYNEYQ